MNTLCCYEELAFTVLARVSIVIADTASKTTIYQRMPIKHNTMACFPLNPDDLSTMQKCNLILFNPYKPDVLFMVH